MKSTVLEAVEAVEARWKGTVLLTSSQPVSPSAAWRCRSSKAAQPLQPPPQSPGPRPKTRLPAAPRPPPLPPPPPPSAFSTRPERAASATRRPRRLCQTAVGTATEAAARAMAVARTHLVILGFGDFQQLLAHARESAALVTLGEIQPEGLGLEVVLARDELPPRVLDQPGSSGPGHPAESIILIRIAFAPVQYGRGAEWQHRPMARPTGSSPPARPGSGRAAPAPGRHPPAVAGSDHVGARATRPQGALPHLGGLGELDLPDRAELRPLAGRRPHPRADRPEVPLARA